MKKPIFALVVVSVAMLLTSCGSSARPSYDTAFACLEAIDVDVEAGEDLEIDDAEKAALIEGDGVFEAFWNDSEPLVSLMFMRDGGEAKKWAKIKAKAAEPDIAAGYAAISFEVKSNVLIEYYDSEGGGPPSDQVRSDISRCIDRATEE